MYNALDGKAHVHRKQMFISIMTDEKIKELEIIFISEWKNQISKWKSKNKIVLYKEIKNLLTKVFYLLVGLPLSKGEVSKRMRELMMLFDYKGSIGSKHWYSRFELKKSIKKLRKSLKKYESVFYIFYLKTLLILLRITAISIIIYSIQELLLSN